MTLKNTNWVEIIIQSAPTLLVALIAAVAFFVKMDQYMGEVDSLKSDIKQVMQQKSEQDKLYQLQINSIQTDVALINLRLKYLERQNTEIE